jgi:molecular chaperone DnaK (HSP70)
MIAIDLGTSNCSVAVSEDGKDPQVVPLEFGDVDSYTPMVMPSAVCVCKAPQCARASTTFGHEALRHTFSLDHDSTLLQEMKIYFDRATASAPTMVESGQGYSLREEHGFLSPVRTTYRQPHWEGDVPLQPKEFVPGTAKLVKELVRKATSVGADRNAIVAGYPASFGGIGIRRLREAVTQGAFGQSDDYSGVRLYPEPLAAARAYMGIQAGNFLVLDYGGGTLDITVMKLPNGSEFKVENAAVSGFPEAGSRIDQAILSYCLDKAGEPLQKWYGDQKPRTKLRIKANVEAAKIKLSAAAEATVEFTGSQFEPVRLTAQDVAYAVQSIMMRMGAKVMEATLRHLGAIENVQYVVLSGGTCLSPVVQDSILALFQHIPNDRFIVPSASKPEDVETCLCAVSKGLALLASEGYPAPAIPTT